MRISHAYFLHEYGHERCSGVFGLEMIISIWRGRAAPKPEADGSIPLQPAAVAGRRVQACAQLAVEAPTFEATLADQEDKLHACVSANICDASQRTPVQEDARPPVQEGNLRD